MLLTELIFNFENFEFTPHTSAYGLEENNDNYKYKSYKNYLNYV